MIKIKASIYMIFWINASLIEAIIRIQNIRPIKLNDTNKQYANVLTVWGYDYTKEIAIKDVNAVSAVLEVNIILTLTAKGTLWGWVEHIVIIENKATRIPQHICKAFFLLAKS